MKHAILLLTFAGLAALAGCEEHKPQVKKAAQAVKEAGAKTGEAVKEAAVKVGEAGKESADKIRRSIHEATRPPDGAPPASDSSVLALIVKDIDGKDVALSRYAGKVLLIVNVASKCGNTPQYEGLQALYESRKDKGLVVLGFPANDFGEQEPGSEAEIKSFCTDTYHVTFPMFSKVKVNGDDACELYKNLAAAKPDGRAALGAPEWNFAKYLVNRKGEVVAKFKASTSPQEEAVLKAIDDALTHP